MQKHIATKPHEIRDALNEYEHERREDEAKQEKLDREYMDDMRDYERMLWEIEEERDYQLYLEEEHYSRMPEPYYDDYEWDFRYEEV